MTMMVSVCVHVCVGKHMRIHYWQQIPTFWKQLQGKDADVFALAKEYEIKVLKCP